MAAAGSNFLMHPEQKFSRKLLGMMPEGAHCQRIETSTGSGVPDINVVHNGNEFWIETKVQTPAGHVLLRPYQWSWLNRRKRAGGWGYVIAQSHENPREILFWGFHNVCIVQHGEYLRVTTTPTVAELTRHQIERMLSR
jgi:hypothetical protein